MEILVLSRREVEYPNKDDFRTEVDHILISVREPREETITFPSNLHRQAILQLVFSDINTVGLDNKWQQVPQVILFSIKHAEDILKFLNDNSSSKRLICQCTAGISRSAGIAAAISKIVYDDDTYFHKRYIPNSRVRSIILGEYFVHSDKYFNIGLLRSNYELHK